MKLVNPIDALQREIAKYPTQRGAAKALGISTAYLSDLVNGRRNVSDAMLVKLGLRRVVVK